MSPNDPPAGPRAHNFSIGAGELIVLADGYRTFPLPDGLIANADRAAINRALGEAGMPADQMTIHFNPAIVRHAGQTILIDTGNGAAAMAEEGSTRGWMLASMKTAGIAPDDVDTVLLTHFHGDHVSGLLDADGNPVFPRAAIKVPDAEWRAWFEGAGPGSVQERAGGMVALARKMLMPLEDRIVRFASGDEVAPGLTAVSTAGHTPGHTSFMFESGGERVLIQGDVTNNPALFARHPGWKLAFDMDPDAAEATRRRVYDMASDEGIPVMGFHYPFPSLARLEKDGDGYRWRLVENATP